MKISKHVNGGYRTTLTINGKRNDIYGNSPEEVDTKYTEMKYKHNLGYNVNDNPSMADYMILWYNTFKKDKGALKTQEMYKNCINKHIDTAFGNKKLKEINGTQIQSFLNTIDSSKSLAHKVRITLNQIFKQAIVDHLISFSPVLTSKIIAPDEPKRKHLEPAQRDLLLEILKDHKAYPLAFTILYTGMRMGEALALTWKDIDYDNEIIRVTKATEYDHSKPKTKRTKTKKGVRDIPMPDILANYIRQYQKKTRKSLYVFPSHTGGPMGLTEIKRTWNKANDKIDKWFKDEKNKEMEKYSFHLTFRLLRHTYCTGLFDAGVDEKSAAEIMGHDAEIMREVYTHIQSERKQKTKTKLNTLYEVVDIPQKSAESGTTSGDKA